MKSIITFDTSSHCAMIPIPPVPSYADMILVPYDAWSWMLLGVSIVGYVVVMKFFEMCSVTGFNSPFDVFFRLVGGVLGQSVELRTTRWYHHMLVIIFVVMMFVFGNVYQSIITGVFTAQRHGQRITTFEEMVDVDSGYNFCMVDYAFVDSRNTALKKMKSRMWNEEWRIDLKTIDYEARARNMSALIIECRVVKMLMSADKSDFTHSHPAAHYYILPETFLSDYANLLSSPKSPFQDMLQEFSLRIFESGIRQHWERTLPFSHVFRPVEDPPSHDYLLLDDLVYVFIIYGIGMALATVGFVIELLWWKREEKKWREKVLEERKMARRRRRIEDEPAQFDVVEEEDVDEIRSYHEEAETSFADPNQGDWGDDKNPNEGTLYVQEADEDDEDSLEYQGATITFEAEIAF